MLLMFPVNDGDLQTTLIHKQCHFKLYVMRILKNAFLEK